MQNISSKVYNGGSYLWQGVEFFFINPPYYRYAILPLLVLLLLYTASAFGAWWLYRYIESLLPDISHLWAWIQWILVSLKYLFIVIYGLSLLIFAGSLTNSLFEAFGAIFFDDMIAKFANQQYSVPIEKITAKENLAMMSISIWYAIQTLMLSLLGFIISLIVPFGGFLVVPFLTARRIGTSYLWSAVLVDKQLKNRSILLEKSVYERFGFGLLATLLLSIPLLGVVIVTGMTIGGAMLYFEVMNPPEKRLP